MTAPSTDFADIIAVRGARTHNLRDVSVELPVGKLTVITGVSGSGKSSLAFDTIFAEGQRRYLDSVSVHAQSLLRQMPRADVDEITGLSPTISVDQRTAGIPVRSTLAMLTEIHDYLRVLYARAGTAHCTQCGQPVQRQTVDQILSRTLQLPERTRVMILSPMIRGRRGAHKDVLERIVRNGFVRARIDGELQDLAEQPKLSPSKSHTIEAVVDRIVIKDGITPRLRESIELACREGDGMCVVSHERDGQWNEQFFSTRFNCPECDLNFPSLEPRSFNHNSPWGACAECAGLGEHDGVSCATCCGSRLQPFAARVTFGHLTLPELLGQSVDEAGESLQSWITAETESNAPSSGAARSLSQEARLVAERTVPDVLARLQSMSQLGIGYLTLNRSSRSLSGGEYQRARLAATLAMPVSGATVVLDEPTCGLHPRDTHRLLRALNELRDAGSTVIVVEHDGDIMRAADWLIDLGPGAGAEGGRLLFAGSPHDATRMAHSPTGDYLRGLRSGLAADDRQTPVRRTSSPSSVESDGLEVRRTGSRAESRGEVLTIRRARLHNLKNITVEIPLRQLVCVTGVSGSGKSSLIMGTLLPVVTATIAARGARVDAAANQPTSSDVVEGIEQLQRVVALNQEPPGTSSRSCIATLCGIWDDVRRIFARTREARARGFKSSHFSFNSGPGRCPTCRGTGRRSVRMSLLPEVVVPCSECRGRRFAQSVGSIRFAGLSVAEVLELRVDAAADYFREFAGLHKVLDTFVRVGLGYLTLGQPTSTFSGGESQRARLACELAVPNTGHTLFVLDEPTSGLHPADVERLMTHLRDLIAHGHSVVLIEHNLEVIANSDWIIDIGPGSAANGGELVFAGTPGELVQSHDSATGRALLERLP